MATVGQVIDDKYEILKLIGKGGMSKVYLAMDKRLNKQWAVKEVQKNARDNNNEVVVQSAIEEAQMIKELDHPAIVRIVDIIENDEVIYIIEDYIEGETLGSIVEEHGAQPQKLVIDWAMQLCEALEYLHTRKPPIIYRDMKPANVMLKPDGNVKVIDFGIAREYKEHGLADTINLGTRGYAAPEQFGDKGQTDARTDVYCLGATIYHLVSGHNPAEPPYEMKPIRYWNPQLSAGLEVIIQKCTQFNPEDRYQSCAELLYALHHYEEYGAAYRAKQKRKLYYFGTAAGIALAGTLIGSVGMYMRSYVNSADYRQNIEWATRAPSTEEKIAYYSDAIGIDAAEPEAYLGMIEAMEADGVFTSEEEKTLLAEIDKYPLGDGLDTNYANLAYRIGSLYWFCYAYGATDSQLAEYSTQVAVTRMKSAIPWFDYAMTYGGENYENYNSARVFRDIGQFNRDITLNIEKASDGGMYRSYWENLQELVALTTGGQESNERVQLEVYRMTLYSVERYARKFKAEEVTREEMEALCETIRTAVDAIQIDVENEQNTLASIKRDINSRFASAQEAITNAFR